MFAFAFGVAVASELLLPDELAALILPDPLLPALVLPALV